MSEKKKNSSFESASGNAQGNAQEAIMSLIMGGAVTQFIGTAVRLGIPDVLKDGPLSARDIAAKCQTREAETYRFLRGLSVVGLVHENDMQEFSLTPVGQWLRDDIPGSFRPLAMMHSGLWNSETYANLDHTLKTGESAFKKTYGCNLFEWLTRNPHEGALFGEAMSTYSGMEIAMVVQTYDFSNCRCIVDVGGSHGDLLCAILSNNATPNGILFDTPDTIGDAKSRIEQKLIDRMTLMSGDFFSQVPTGGDTYILKHILHDWNDDRATQILKNVARAMTPGAKILVVEQGITPPGVPGPGKMLDLSMMSLTDGGQERTPEQHQKLMENAGLQFKNVIPTEGPITIFEGILP